jgi:dTDP-4-amino-4,6-dideoxygalactose transaminase
LKDYLPFGKPNFSDREIAAVSRTLQSGWIGMGPETLAFEDELASYIDAPHVVTVNSCTSGLLIALRLADVQPGDEIVCPSLTWCSTAAVALYLGARPVFCEVRPETLCVTPDTVSRALTPRTRAVMAVHFGGHAADITALRRVLPPEVAIIEDAAHAFGSRYPDGKRVGASGNLCCFSFYANKTLSTGEGGAVALFDADKAEQIRSLRHMGLSVDAWKRYTNPKTVMNFNISQLGYKANYTDLQAAIGRVQLARQAEFSTRRDAVARVYADGLTGLPLILQEGCLHANHSRHLFTAVLTKDSRLSRDQLLVALRERNIGATIHYEPLHLMPLFHIAGQAQSLPVTEHIASNIITLPIGACVSTSEAKEVVKVIRKLLG